MSLSAATVENGSITTVTGDDKRGCSASGSVTKTTNGPVTNRGVCGGRSKGGGGGGTGGDGGKGLGGGGDGGGGDGGGGDGWGCEGGGGNGGGGDGGGNEGGAEGGNGGGGAHSDELPAKRMSPPVSAALVAHVISNDASTYPTLDEKKNCTAFVA